MKRSERKSDPSPAKIKKKSGIRGKRDIAQDSEIATLQLKKLQCQYLGEHLAIKYGFINFVIQISPPQSPKDNATRDAWIKDQFNALAKSPLQCTELEWIQNLYLPPDQKKDLPIPYKLKNWYTLIRQGHSFKSLKSNYKSELIYHLKQIALELSAVPPITTPWNSNNNASRDAWIKKELSLLSKREDLTNEAPTDDAHKDKVKACFRNWNLPAGRKNIVTPKRLYDLCVLIRSGHPVASLKRGDQQRPVWRRLFVKGFKRNSAGKKKVKMKQDAIRWLHWRLSREALRKINDAPRSSIFGTELLNSMTQAWLLLQPDPSPLIGFLEEFMDQKDGYDPAREIILKTMETGKDFQNENEDEFSKGHLDQHSHRSQKASGWRFLNDERTRIRSSGKKRK